MFSVASLRGMAGFTSNVLGAKTVSWAKQNLDNLLVGRFIGAAALGAYSIAFSLAVTPLNRIALPLSQVLFSAFSRVRDLREIAEFWLRAVRMLAFVVVPAMFGLVVVAPDFVQVVFGDKWLAAAPVLQLLAPVGLMQALTAPNNALLQSVDRTRMLFRYTVVMTTGSICAFVAGLPWGIKGLATAYLLVSLVVQPAFVWLTARTVGLSVWDWLRSVNGVLQAGAAMLIVVALARRGLEGTSLSAAGRLVALILMGAVVYAGFVAWRAPEVRRELRSLLARRRRLRAPASEGTSKAPV
jgi:O-antigen/teichoic acid export membrane protein